MPRSAVLALLCAFIASPALATTIAPADFTAMVAGSHVIVHGTILDVRAQAGGGRRTIETFVTVAVATPLKGESADTVVFRVPGGQVGRYRRVMVGAPEFAVGEEVVLFLSGRAPAMPMPFGLNQGVYRVTRGGAGAMVAPLVTEASGRIVRGDPARRPMALDAFAREVRTAARRAP
jgi:hypothetical protein